MPQDRGLDLESRDDIDRDGVAKKLVSVGVEGDRRDRDLRGRIELGNIEIGSEGLRRVGREGVPVDDEDDAIDAEEV